MISRQRRNSVNLREKVGWLKDRKRRAHPASWNNLKATQCLVPQAKQANPWQQEDFYNLGHGSRHLKFHR